MVTEWHVMVERAWTSMNVRNTDRAIRSVQTLWEASVVDAMMGLLWIQAPVIV